MKPIAAIQNSRPTKVLVQLVNGILQLADALGQMTVAYQPARRLCDRILSDIGEHRFSELRGVRADLAARGDRFRF